ncbi:hypothetical protein BJ165DRAFT_1594849 [Panaeolus papilionaceus]|nr:hypothetical protein BJ165DRAFT_1594849 [Panaeolus papilionaceus]
MPSNLPIEIYQVIIDFIAQDTEWYYISAQTMRDLCACCLVCTSFVPLCQRHIFAQATIGKMTSQGYVGLHSALRERPGLSAYMKRLVYLNRQDATKSTAPCMSALMNLPQLHRLDLWCRDTSPIFGRDISEPFGPGQFFKHCISSGTLTTLSFYRVQFLPIYDVLSAVNLTYLQIRGCGFKVEPNLLPHSTSLRHLDIDGPLEGITNSPTLPQMFPDLRKLRVRDTVYDHPTEATRTLNRILETTGDLECLAVEADFTCFWHQPEVFPLHIQQCLLNSQSSLKRLHFYLTVNHAWFVHEGMYNVLSAVTGHNVIEEVEFVIFFSGYYLPSMSQVGQPLLSYNVTPTLETWSKLDELLDDKNSFPCLEKVSVLIVLEDRFRLYCEEVLPTPKLDLAGIWKYVMILRIDFQIFTNFSIRTKIV